MYGPPFHKRAAEGREYGPASQICAIFCSNQTRSVLCWSVLFSRANLLLQRCPAHICDPGSLVCNFRVINLNERLCEKFHIIVMACCNHTILWVRSHCNDPAGVGSHCNDPAGVPLISSGYHLLITQCSKKLSDDLLFG